MIHKGAVKIKQLLSICLVIKKLQAILMVQGHKFQAQLEHFKWNYTESPALQH